MHFRSCSLILYPYCLFFSFPSAGCSYKLEIGFDGMPALKSFSTFYWHFLSEQSAFGISFLTNYFGILIFTLSLLFGSDLKNNFLRLTCLIILWRLNASRKWRWQFIFGYSFIKHRPFCRDFQNDFPFGNLSAYRKLCFLVVCFLCDLHISVCQQKFGWGSFQEVALLLRCSSLYL